MPILGVLDGSAVSVAVGLVVAIEVGAVSREVDVVGVISHMLNDVDFATSGPVRYGLAGTSR